MTETHVKRSRRRFSDTERAAVLAEYKQSDLSQVRFCEEKGISPSTLQNWIRRSRDAEEPPRPVALVPVRLRSSVSRFESPGPDRCYEISLSPSRHLSVPPGFDPEEVRTLVSILEE
jgi:transposase-like protein